MTLARVLHFRFSCFSLKMGLRKIVWGGGRCSMFFLRIQTNQNKKKGTAWERTRGCEADSSFLILLAMAPLILPTFAHICFIGFCPAVVNSNPVCGRMLKKQVGRSLFLWLLPHCVLLVVAPTYFIGFSPSIIFGFELKLFNVQMLETLFYWCCASVILLAVAFWPHHVFLALARTRFVFNQYNLIF